MGQPKGCIPWNKNKKGLYPAWNKGIKMPQISGENHPHWSGGTHKRADGYISVYSPSHPRVKKRPYVFAHILVAEKMLGRYIKENEVVHHINGKRDDNAPENLIVLTRYEHMKHHNVSKFRKFKTLAQKGLWNRVGDKKCKKCSTTEKQHWGLGYCRNCYRSTRSKHGKF